MRPGEVLDAQGDLLERLGNPTFHTVVNALGSFEFGRSGGYREAESTTLGSMLGSTLRAAHTFRVTHDMSMLVEHAAAGLEDLDHFDHDLAPTQCGFVSFDRPLPLKDQRGKTMLVHFLTWGPVKVSSMIDRHATLVTAFNDIWRQADEVQGPLYDETYAAMVPKYGEAGARKAVENHKVAMGRWATVGSSAYVDGQRLGPLMKMPTPEQQAKILAEGDTPSEGMNMIRYVHALWLMMEQTVARVEPEEPDRPSRRRAVKRKLPPKVTVIKLRRETGGSQRQHGESDIEWAHRWVVRGHWRWQVVSPHHPLAQEIEPGKYRARIWINPFVKGPADKPFVQSEKVYSLER